MPTVNRQLKPYPPANIEINDTSSASGDPEITVAANWTLQNLGNGNTVNPATGQIFVNYSWYWVSGGYTSLRTLTARNKLTVTPTSDTNSKGGWGLGTTSGAQCASDLPFCWSRKTTGNWCVRELGVIKYDSGSTAYQTMAVDVSPTGVVTYYRNGVLVYTSLSTVASDFYFKAQGGFYAFDNTFTTSDSSGAGLTGATMTTGTGLSISGRLRLDWNNRNRIANTKIIKPTAANEAVESGQTNTLRIYAANGVTLLRTVSAITNDFYEYQATDEVADGGGSGLQASLRFELESIRDGIVSFQKHNFTRVR